MICWNCGTQLQDNDIVCSNCGQTQDVQAIKCDKCGKFTNKNFGVCPFCGNIFDEIVEESAAKESVVSDTSSEKHNADEANESIFVQCPMCRNKYDLSVGVCTICGYSHIQNDMESQEELIGNKEHITEGITEINSPDKSQNPLFSLFNKDSVNYKKTGVIAAFVLCVVIAFSFILFNPKNTGVSTNQIKTDIEQLQVVTNGVVDCDYTPFSPYSIENYKIEKRQTNKKEKEDIVFCNVEIKNQYYKTDLELKLTYIYYDKGGWILENHNIISESTVPISAICKDEIPELRVEIKNKQVDLTKANITSVNFDSANLLSSINYEYSDEFYTATGVVISKFENNIWSTIKSKDFLLDDIRTNWNNVKFRQTLSGNFEYISYIDVSSGKKCAGSSWLFVNNESEKSIKDNYYTVDFPSVEYNISIDKISQETGKISGKIALKQRFYFHDFSELKNGFEEVPFEADFDVETGNFSVIKAFNTVCYRQDTFQNTYKDITYVPVELKFDFGFGGYSEKGSWGFKVSLHNIQIGNKIQCSYDEYTRAKYPWK